MPPAPRISVIMPAYNAAAFVARGIRSVWGQTRPIHELIVVDDGSRDDTAEVARRCDPRTRVITQKNGGPGAARNRGVRESCGDWLAFLDADDAWQPNKIERQCSVITPDVDVIFNYVVDPDPSHEPPAVVNFDALWRSNCIGMSTALVRREVFVAVGGFDEDREIIGVEDYNLWLRMAARQTRFRFLAEELVAYTPAPGNLSSQYQRLASCAARNIEKVAEVVPVDPSRLNAKLAEIYEEYGTALLHDRNLPAARQLLKRALRHRPDRRTAVRWLSTFAPRQLLDLRRTLVKSVAPFLS